MKARTVKGFSRYRIWENGTIENTETGRIIKGSKKSSGYIETGLKTDDGKRKDILIHRLVAEAFVPKPRGVNVEVNHKNGDKTDNRVCNLEWISHNDNLKHAYETGLREQDVSGKAVIAQKIGSKEIKRFASIYRAARALKISQGNICMCCKGQRSNAGGYMWNYEK